MGRLLGRPALEPSSVDRYQQTLLLARIASCAQNFLAVHNKEEQVMFRSPSFPKKAVWVSTAVSVAMLACGSPSEARVTRIVIDATAPLTGQNIAYTQMRGRAFGVLDPNDPHNQIITDIQLGKDADGMVRYE